MSEDRKRSVRISQSFNGEQIELLDNILQTLIRGGTGAPHANNPELPPLAHKLSGMKETAEKRRAGDENAGTDEDG